MSTIQLGRTVLLSATLFAAGALQALGADKAPEEKTGIKLGAKAPSFKLLDQSGKERSLEEFLQRGKVALVFYRSASW